jgi:hypothetical protein
MNGGKMPIDAVLKNDVAMPSDMVGRGRSGGPRSIGSILKE